MDVNKARVLKRYLKKNAHPNYLKLLREMPLHTLIVLETYTGDKHILKISYFSRKDFEFKAYIFATSLELYPDGFESQKCIEIIFVPLDSIKSWKLLTPSYIPLTINWSMCDWYKTKAFNK